MGIIKQWKIKRMRKKDKKLIRKLNTQTKEYEKMAKGIEEIEKSGKAIPQHAEEKTRIKNQLADLKKKIGETGKKIEIREKTNEIKRYETQLQGLKEIQLYKESTGKKITKQDLAQASQIKTELDRKKKELKELLKNK